MKAQYQEHVSSNNNTTTHKVDMNNLVVLRGLSERDSADYLPAFVSAYYPHPMGLRALDLSAGYGVAALTLADMGFQVAAFDMHRNSISIVQKVAMKKELNISFGIGGIPQMEKMKKEFDLIHDCQCLTMMTAPQERVNFLVGIQNALAQDGKFILKTLAWNPAFDTDESFESICLQEDILWRQTPASDVPGVVEMNGKHWTAQKRIAPIEKLREEVKAAGFDILVEELETPRGNHHTSVRLVLTSAIGR